MDILRKQHTLFNKAKDYNAKLSNAYNGPYIVPHRVSPVIFDLKIKAGKITRHILVRDLKEYRHEHEAET